MQSPLEIRFHPADLSIFGRSPGGLPLYRVVWADSRITKLFHDSEVLELPFYGPDTLTSGQWILERWLPPERYIGMTREKFETFVESQRGEDGELPPTEAWPSQGEYELADIFSGHVDVEEIREAIAKTEHDFNHLSPFERVKEVHERFAQRQKRKKEMKNLKIEEILGRDAKKPEVKGEYSFPLEVVNG